MARLKLKQVYSNLSYNTTTNELHVSASANTSLIITGSVYVTSSSSVTGSITISGVDNFGDSGSFYTVDLGEY